MLLLLLLFLLGYLFSYFNFSGKWLDGFCCNIADMFSILLLNCFQCLRGSFPFENFFIIVATFMKFNTRIGDLISIIFCFDENFSTPILFYLFYYRKRILCFFSKYYSSYSFWPAVMRQVSLASGTGGLQKLRYRFLNFIFKKLKKKLLWKIKKKFAIYQCK